MGVERRSSGIEMQVERVMDTVARKWWLILGVALMTEAVAVVALKQMGMEGVDTPVGGIGVSQVGGVETNMNAWWGVAGVREEIVWWRERGPAWFGDSYEETTFYWVSQRVGRGQSIWELTKFLDYEEPIWRLRVDQDEFWATVTADKGKICLEVATKGDGAYIHGYSCVREGK